MERRLGSYQLRYSFREGEYSVKECDLIFFAYVLAS